MKAQSSDSELRKQMFTHVLVFLTHVTWLSLGPNPLFHPQLVFTHFCQNSDLPEGSRDINSDIPYWAFCTGN